MMKNRKSSRGKFAVIFLVMALLFSSVLFGCSGSDSNVTESADTRSEAVTEETTEDETSEEVDISDEAAEEEAEESEEAVSEEEASSAEEEAGSETAETISYTFRNKNALEGHYEKHGIEMGFDSAEEYEAAASAVVNNPEALHKTEAEDGDDVYYVEDTNEFVVVSTDGYIRTYFYPSAGKRYYDRQ